MVAYQEFFHLFCYNIGRLLLEMSDKMNDMKNINVESDFKDRTGLIVRVSNKRNVKRLMKFGVLHYVSKKMSYVILYVDTHNVDSIIERIQKENYVSSVEKSQLKDLPITYDGVLEELKKDIANKKKKENLETFSKRKEFNPMDW